MMRTEEELVKLEVQFTDEWFKTHTTTPTLADAIAWAYSNITVSMILKIIQYYLNHKNEPFDEALKNIKNDLNAQLK